MATKNKTAARPRLACELAAEHVVGARVRQEGGAIDVYTARALPAGALTPSLTLQNIHDAEAVRDAISSALEPLGGRARDVAVVLPDAAARVVLLDFESLPQRREDADAVVRFRLRKSLPFDVDRAAVSYDVQTVGGELKLVAAVALRAVVEEYETVFRDAGYLPGVVLPSTLAALGLVDEGGASMVVKVAADTTTVAIVDDGRLRLFRTIENARHQPPDGEELAEAVYPSVVFFTDTFQERLERLLVSGIAAAQAAPALEAQTGARVAELVTAERMGESLGGRPAPAWVLAGVAGALV